MCNCLRICSKLSCFMMAIQKVFFNFGAVTLSNFDVNIPHCPLGQCLWVKNGKTETVSFKRIESFLSDSNKAFLYKIPVLSKESYGYLLKRKKLRAQKGGLSCNCFQRFFLLAIKLYMVGKKGSIEHKQLKESHIYFQRC